MIPQNQDDLRQDFVIEPLPTRTFRMNHDYFTVAGMVDNRKALEQAIFLILNTERYQWLIHSWNYGVELHRLIGKDPEYCIPEIERSVREALLQDDRILSVDNFIFQVEKNNVTANFTVFSIYGEIKSNLEVEI